MNTLRSLLQMSMTIALLLFAGCGTTSGEQAIEIETIAPASGTIVAFGDSLTAGTGVQTNESYPARLERLLKEQGYQYTVLNMGRSGDTSAGALARIESVIAAEPDIVILAIGANDALSLTPPDVMRQNIEEIVTRLQEEGITIILAGSPVIILEGWAYPEEFTRVQPEIAQRHNLTYVPSFLNGVAGNPALNLNDRAHPNAQGYAAIAENLLPSVIQAIESR